MLFRFVALAVCLWVPGMGGAAADTFPAAYQVHDVAQTDVLNIRATPSSAADVVGQIGSFALTVEVLETSSDGKWGRVSTAGGTGWVRMRYLAPMPASDPGLVPRPLSCFGTEPFWNIGLFARGAEYNSPDTGAVPMAVVHEAVAPQGYLVRLEEGPVLKRTLVITRQACSDGMSDRTYGFAATMFLEAPDGNAVHGACCTLDHR